MLEPLVDLVFGLSALDHIQPITAWPFGILGGHDLHPVAVPDFIIDGHQLTVNPGANHPIADRTVNAVGKVDGSRPGRQVLHIPGRCKAIYTVREKIQIAFQQMKTGYGCTLAFSIFLVILMMTLLQFGGQKKWVTYDYE